MSETQGKNVENFHHVKHELSLEDEEEQARPFGDSGKLISNMSHMCFKDQGHPLPLASG